VSPVDTRTGKPVDLVSPESAHGDRERALRESGFTTVVRVGERAGETLPLAEALAETVGVRVRSLGGLGGFSSVSVRGAPPGHTAVFIDGVPLARLGSATADLGRFELGSFSRIQLHRGAVPAALGGAVQASALELVTELGPVPDEHPLLLSAGVGSFGTRHLRARWLGGSAHDATATGDTSGFHLGLGYAGTEGDFVYFDDNGTNLNDSDDEYVERDNNGHDRVDAVARAGLNRGPWSLSGGARSLWRHQGVPGSVNNQSRTASLTTWSQMVDGAAERADAFDNPALTARAGAHGLVELERYRDLDNEVGIGIQDRRYLTAAAGTSASLAAELSPAHTTSAGVEAGLEVFTDTDLAPPAGERSERERGLRLSGAAILSHRMRLLGPAGERARLEPAVRLDLSRIDPIADPEDGVASADLSPRIDFHATPRIALWLRAAADLSVKASAGLYLRSPTALELYGDRGALIGNPALEPETGESGDLGLVWAPAGAAGWIDRIYIEAAGFAARSRDTIVWVPTAALVAGPRNLGSAKLWGGELVASARAARAVTLTVDYTHLGSRQGDTLTPYEGKELPQRPRHQLHGRADLAGRAASRLFVLFGDAALVGSNHLDPGNQDQVPRRVLIGAGLKLEIVPRLFAAIEGKNLADSRVEDIPYDRPPSPEFSRVPQAISDFFGYPLPGRAFYLTLQWEP
jgi:vitamin B12 transporter